MKWIQAAAGLLLAALAAACGGDGSAAPGPSARDSAGVRIVENGAIPAADWRVEREPLFTVGWGDDDPMFTWLQSGRILPDGGALVGDFTTGMIYRIGSEGSVVQTWGRKGEGPGEYQAFDAILLREDSILVADGRLGRLTLLSPDGAIRTAPMDNALLHTVSSVMTDGRLLLVPMDGYRAVDETRAEWVFEMQPILAVDPGGSSLDTLAVLPHMQRWYGTRGGVPNPLRVRGGAGGFGDGFAWARSDEREVRWYDGSGGLVQLSRWDEEPVPLTSERKGGMARMYEESFRSINADEAFVTSQLAELQGLLDRHTGPLPWWDSFHVDRTGNAWLRAYALPGQPVAEEWRVFSRDGTIVGWINLPGVSVILDISDDRILAVRIGELDVPAVMMLDLIKPNP